MTELKVFDYVNSINTGKESLMRGGDEEANEAGYNAYLTNVAMSYFVDTVLHANVMNQHHHLDKRPQYEFLFNSIRKKKRFAKWHKAEQSDDLDLICKHYSVNKTIGREYLELLSAEDIQNIRKQYHTGGI